MILRQFVTGSNSVEEIYIVKSDCLSLINENIDNKDAPSNVYDATQLCGHESTENTQIIINNCSTESNVIIPAHKGHDIDRKANLDVTPDSTEKTSAQNRAQLRTDELICNLCLVKFSTMVMLKQHLNLIHHHMLPFKCKSCACKEIRSVLMLNKHFAQHDLSKLNQCRYCNARFDSTARCSLHQRQYHPDEFGNHEEHNIGRYTCRYCEKRFVAKANFERHERNHEKMLALEGENNIFDFLHHCYLCSMQFNSKQTLYAHLNVHVDRLPFRCEKCPSTNETISSVRTLNKHIALHLEKKPVKCIYCEDRFISIKECEAHEILNHSEAKANSIYNPVANDIEDETPKASKCVAKNIHNDGATRYECSFCDKSYSLLSTLRRHENVHTGKRQFICKICGKMFKKSSCLSQHERTHLNDFPYKCSYCGKGFKQTIRLIEHRRIHTGEKPFQCNHCMMRFRLKSLLKEHIDKCNTNRTPRQEIRCEYCDRLFSSKQLFVKHAMELHLQHMPTDGKCRFCDMKLKSIAILLEHEFRHRQPGVIECKQCGRIFKQRSNLRRHQQLHTVNAMPHKCDLCEKSFSQLSTMKVHRRVHTEEKPYKCELCLKGFQHSSTKNRHQRSHHKQGGLLVLPLPFTGNTIERGTHDQINDS